MVKRTQIPSSHEKHGKSATQENLGFSKLLSVGKSWNDAMSYFCRAHSRSLLFQHNVECAKEEAGVYPCQHHMRRIVYGK